MGALPGSWSVNSVCLSVSASVIFVGNHVKPQEGQERESKQMGACKETQQATSKGSQQREQGDDPAAAGQETPKEQGRSIQSRAGHRRATGKAGAGREQQARQLPTGA